MLLLALVFAVLAVGAATPISPAQIAEARQRCTQQCENPNKLVMASCMRECWNAFFADRQQSSKRQVAERPSATAKRVAPKVQKPVAVATKKHAAMRTPKFAHKEKSAFAPGHVARKFLRNPKKGRVSSASGIAASLTLLGLVMFALL